MFFVWIMLFDKSKDVIPEFNNGIDIGSSEKPLILIWAPDHSEFGSWQAEHAGFMN